MTKFTSRLYIAGSNLIIWGQTKCVKVKSTVQILAFAHDRGTEDSGNAASYRLVDLVNWSTNGTRTPKSFFICLIFSLIALPFVWIDNKFEKE